MRPPLTKALQIFALVLGALGLVLTSAGLAGAEAPASPGNSEAAIPEHAAAASHDDADAEEQDPAVTEDNDGNDGGTPNNVVDDDDNAHPSGKDRSVENGGSGNQGNAQSDPDDDGRGPDRSPEGDEGADKPGGPGGVDKADQDGNNGCGNDDDFEDDNEGLCLGPDRAPGQQPDEVERCPDNETVVTDDTDGDDDGVADMCQEQVLGEQDEFCPGTETVVTDDTDGDDDGVPDMCEERSDGGQPPAVDNNNEQLPPRMVENEQGGPLPAPVTEVEGDTVVLTPRSPAQPAGPTVVPVPSAAPTVQAVTDRNPQVLGSQVTRSPSALAATGAGTNDLVPFGLGLVLLGFAIQRKGRTLSAARVR